MAADDERRAEIGAEELATALKQHFAPQDVGYGRMPVTAHAIDLARWFLDRVRDARGDDEGCPHNDDDCAMGTCNFCGPDGVYGKRGGTRSPQGEDHEARWDAISALAAGDSERAEQILNHEAGIEDAKRAFLRAGGEARWPYAWRAACDAYLARVSPSRDGTVAVEDGHCPRCGEYMPKTVDGMARVHGCNRTPPLDGLPFTIYACPRCGGHGASRWGCWGTADHPHEHVYMRPVHELVAESEARIEMLIRERDHAWAIVESFQQHEGDSITGAAMIAAERQRQIDRERGTPEHDDLHDDGELLCAALCYATPSGLRDPIGKGRLPRSWPWEADAWKPTPDDRVRELVKAGALIAAEIDRLQRSVDKGAS